MYFGLVAEQYTYVTYNHYIDVTNLEYFKQ